MNYEIKVITTALVATIAAVALSAAALSQQPKTPGADKATTAQHSAKSLEDFLKELKWNYRVIGEGLYKFTVEAGDEAFIMVGREVALGQDESSADLSIVQLLTAVLQLPQDSQPSAAMLQLINR